jgi:hypothetical protein
MKTIQIFILIMILAVPFAHSAWTWHNPLPAGNTLNAAATDGDGRFAAVGESGYLLQWHAGTGDFTAPVFDTFQQMHAVKISADGGGIAAGERANVFLRSNGQWELNPPPTGPNTMFYGAARSPNGTYWVCGDLGEIYRYHNGIWEQTPSSTTSTLKDIDMVSETRGWTVGLFGTARVWNGTSWQFFSSQTTRFLRRVSGYSDTVAWVVGDLGTIIRWTGAGFVTESSGVTRNLFDVVAVSDTDAWAVGDRGTVLRRTQDGWETVTNPALPADENFRSIAYAGPDSILITGINGLMVYYDGQDWISLQQDAFDGADVFTVHVGSQNDHVLFGTERGRIYRYHDGVFEQQVTGVTDTIRIIREDDDEVLWAGGDTGRLLMNDGGGWVPVPTGDDETIYDIDFLPEGDIWTAGGISDDGCQSWSVLHYDGNTWAKYGESGT